MSLLLINLKPIQNKTAIAGMLRSKVFDEINRLEYSLRIYSLKSSTNVVYTALPPVKSLSLSHSFFLSLFMRKLSRKVC